MKYNNSFFIALLHMLMICLHTRSMDQLTICRTIESLKQKYENQTKILFDKDKKNKEVSLQELTDYKETAQQYFDQLPQSEKKLKEDITKKIKTVNTFIKNSIISVIPSSINEAEDTLDDLINYRRLTLLYISMLDKQEKSKKIKYSLFFHKVTQRIDLYNTANELLRVNYTNFTVDELIAYREQLFSIQDNISIESSLFQQLSDVFTSTQKILRSKQQVCNAEVKIKQLIKEEQELEKEIQTLERQLEKKEIVIQLKQELQKEKQELEKEIQKTKEAEKNLEQFIIAMLIKDILKNRKIKIIEPAPKDIIHGVKENKMPKVIDEKLKTNQPSSRFSKIPYIISGITFTIACMLIFYKYDQLSSIMEKSSLFLSQFFHKFNQKLLVIPPKNTLFKRS